LLARQGAAVGGRRTAAKAEAEGAAKVGGGEGGMGEEEEEVEGWE